VLSCTVTANTGNDMNWKNKGSDLVVGVSGGKDSLAVCLHFMEYGYKHKRVFADTGWEHPQTYEYIRTLEEKIGGIDRVAVDVAVDDAHKAFVEGIEADLGFVSPFVRLIVQKMCIPNPRRKFCTPRLKVDPIAVYLNGLEDPINVVGIRHEEGRKRSQMIEWEWFDCFDCYTWRPILQWSFDDVRAIHKRWNIKPNPLYLNGHDRVGCYPCIYANKRDLKNLDDQRVKIIKRIEEYVSHHRGKTTTMYKFMSIDQAMQWAKTSRGGKQYALFDTQPPTCAKWGMCGI
jgi:3'-phosphoadenosine 5'-phosphosulfate sulfotransferase (PAPS reductase)/FAD synthetase